MYVYIYIYILCIYTGLAPQTRSSREWLRTKKSFLPPSGLMKRACVSISKPKFRRGSRDNSHIHKAEKGKL